MAPETEPLSPDEAFWLLGDETRVAILRAVWSHPEATASFTEIREAVGRPDSGAFNYHLNQLKGHFLTEEDPGYELTQAGREVVRAVMAGTLTQRPATEPRPIDGTCVECGGELVVQYDEYGIVECGECGSTVMWNEFPPAGLEGRDPDEVATAFDRWTQRRFRLAMDGVCPSCAAPMSVTVEGADDGGELASTHRCGNCRYEARVPLFGHVLEHPALVAFCYERGVDVSDQPYWHLQRLAREFVEEVISEEPWRAAVTADIGGDRLRLTLDENLDIVDVDLLGS